MRKGKQEDYLSGNLTAMIDVVFQLIIFFVCTVNMQDSVVNGKISMAMAPHGRPVTAKNPLEINVDVDRRGLISINNTAINLPLLQDVLRKAVADYGQQVPVVIRGDARTSHENIRKVMDACARSGIWKIKFAALKESSGG